MYTIIDKLQRKFAQIARRIVPLTPSWRNTLTEELEVADMNMTFLGIKTSVRAYRMRSGTVIDRQKVFTETWGRQESPSGHQPKDLLASPRQMGSPHQLLHPGKISTEDY